MSEFELVERLLDDNDRLVRENVQLRSAIEDYAGLMHLASSRITELERGAASRLV